MSLSSRGGDDMRTAVSYTHLRMLTDEVFLRESGMNASNYVTGNAGATDKIMSMINF